jgi:arylsulfatase A-like enzyme
VFTADHGEGLYENGVIQHGWIYNAETRIPLIMRFPDGRRGRISQMASLIDVLPILAEEAGIPLDTNHFDGVNLFREKREFALSQREFREPGWRALNLALTSLDWKYQLFEGGEDLLADLRQDPHESRNVLDQNPMVADRMRREILALVEQSSERSALEVDEDIPSVVIDQMRALGYVE